jgi:hypothetical protein
MTRYSGEIGFGITEETPPGSGNWITRIVAKEMKGDVRTNSSSLNSGESVNPGVSLSNTISLAASTYALQNYQAIRYAKWMGVRWAVRNVEVQRPRLLLSLGEVYNGPTPPTTP